MAIQRQLQLKPGSRKDVDKKVEEMNDEEKAVFDCLEDTENVFANAYDELEEDFMLILNDGKPALELIDQVPVDLDKPVGENEGIIVVEDKPGEEGQMPGMIENYKEKMADVIAMLDRQEEIRKDAISKG
jgi:hypothetical protein